METIQQRSAVQVLRATADHDAALAEFYRATWDPLATGDTVRRARNATAASNPVSPGKESPSFILLHDSKIVGYLGTIPVRIWSDKQEHPAHWVKGLMVLPEFRNGPVAFLVLRETLKHLNCSMALAVLPVVVGLSVRLGFSDLGRLPNFVRILRPAKLARHLRLEEIGFLSLPVWVRKAAAACQRFGLASAAASLLVGGFTRLVILTRGRPSPSFSVKMGMPEAAEIDDLWQRTRQTISAGLVRDSRYLFWRYSRERSDLYRFVGVRNGDRLVALAVVRRPRAEGDPRLHGATVATISEWIFPLQDPHAGLAALSGIDRIAKEFGADAILCSATHRHAHDLLRRRGYWRAPPNVHLLTRDPAKNCALPADLSNWWVTRGDSNADEVF